MKSEQTRVANEILRQLGGGRFTVMTGSTNYMSVNGNDLWMKLRRNSTPANYLKIVLNSMDTYDMTFMRITSKTHKTVVEYHGIYNDGLQDVFTEVTGLYTKF